MNSFLQPPPYSFVYKSNYTNPVEPGPLVPGIILPPPPNFFGRLNEKEETAVKSTPSTTTTTTTTTTTARTTTAKSTTTTQRPYKQVLRPVYRPNTSTSTSTTSTTTTTTASTYPVTYPVTYIPTVKSVKSHKVQTEPFRQNVLNPTQLPTPTTTPKVVTHLKGIKGQEILQFVPKEAILNGGSLSGNKGKPIYYEYFDARIKANVNTPFVSSTTTTAITPTVTVRPQTQQQKQHHSAKQQLHPSAKQLRRPTNAYLPVKPPTDYEKYVIITPKPESKPSKPNAIATNTVQIGDSQRYTKPHANVAVGLKSYNTEIDNIRHTIEFFKNQEKQKQSSKSSNDSSVPPRHPKAKAVYEYSFDSAPQKASKLFQPPTEFDSSPFKPMVQYSLPLNAENGFKAIAYTTVPTAATETFPTTTSSSAPTAAAAAEPIPTSNLRYIPTFNAAVSKKPAIQFIPFDTVDVKPNSLKYTEYTTVAPSPSFPATPTPLPIAQVHPWISVEKQILREIKPKEINVQVQSHAPTPRPVSLLRGISEPYEYVNPNDGHYNNQIYYPIRTPSTYYQQPQLQQQLQPQRPVMTAQQNAYLRQIEAIRQKLQQFPNQYRINVANSTVAAQNLAYRVPRPLGSAQNNFITSYQFDSNRYPNLQQILSPNYNIPPPPAQRLPPQVLHPLHRDVLVNYKYPLPPIDPDSEFIRPPPHLLHPLPPALPQSPQPTPPPPPIFNRYSRLIRKQPTVVQYKLPGDQQAGVIFYTPGDDKYENTDEK